MRCAVGLAFMTLALAIVGCGSGGGSPLQSSDPFLHAYCTQQIPDANGNNAPLYEAESGTLGDGSITSCAKAIDQLAATTHETPDTYAADLGPTPPGY
jgi:hypothetical protein